MPRPRSFARSAPSMVARTRLGLEGAEEFIPEAVVVSDKAELFFAKPLWRAEFWGADRFRQAHELWQEIMAKSRVETNTYLPGSGLSGLWAFTFSPDSAYPSVLQIFSQIRGRAEGRDFSTRVDCPGLVADSWKNPGKLLPPPVFGPGQITDLAFMESVRRVSRIPGLKKVVLARDTVANLDLAPEDAVDLSGVLERLLVGRGSGTAYMFEGFFGVSPEILLRKSSNRIFSRVLAGTAPVSANGSLDMPGLTTPKQRLEHALAAKSAQDSLTPLCVEAIKTAPRVLRLPNLEHLASDLSGRLLEGVSALEVLSVLHPTAAIAGYPRDIALEVIARYELLDRGYYGGALGWIDSRGSADFCLALRCARLESDRQSHRLRAFSGCGLVRGSDPETELREIRLKLGLILRVTEGRLI